MELGGLRGETPERGRDRVELDLLDLRFGARLVLVHHVIRAEEPEAFVLWRRLAQTIPWKLKAHTPPGLRHA